MSKEISDRDLDSLLKGGPPEISDEDLDTLLSAPTPGAKPPALPVPAGAKPDYGAAPPLAISERHQQQQQKRFPAAATTALTHTGTRPEEPDTSAVRPTLADLQEPISKKALGFSLSDIAEAIFPEAPQLALEQGGSPKIAALYGMARSGAKLAAGAADWMQSPEALAATAITVISGGAATPVVGTLLGLQFGAEGTKQAIEGLEDIRKTGFTPENIEKFLTGLTIAEGGMIGVGHGLGANKVTAAKVQEAKIKALAKSKPFLDRAKSYAASAVDEIRGFDERSALEKRAGTPKEKSVDNLAADGISNQPEAKLSSADIDAVLSKQDVEPTPQEARTPPFAGLLKDPDLVAQGVQVDIPGIDPEIAVPVGGSRRSGELGGDVTREQAEAAIEQLKGKPGFENVRFEPMSAGADIGSVFWGEKFDKWPPRTPEEHAAAGEQFGYRTETTLEAPTTDSGVSGAVQEPEVAATPQPAKPEVVPEVSTVSTATKVDTPDPSTMSIEQLQAEIARLKKEVAGTPAETKAPKAETKPPKPETKKAKAAPPAPLEETKPKTAREHLVRNGAQAEMEQWAADVRAAQEGEKAAKSGRAMATSAEGDVNAEGKLTSEETIREATVPHSLGAKEGSPLADWEESPGDLAKIIDDKGGSKSDSKKMQTYREIQRAFRDRYDSIHGEEMDNYLRNATEEQRRDLFGDEHTSLEFPERERTAAESDLMDELTGAPEEGDVSFDFGDEGRDPQAGHAPILDAVVRKINDTIDSVREYVTTDVIPRLTKAGVQKETVQQASARTAVPRIIDDLLSQVFPEREGYKKPESMEPAMRAMVLDNILGGYDDLAIAIEMALENGDMEAAKRYAKMRNDIEARHDLESYEDEVTQASHDTSILRPILRWIQTVNPLMDQLYNEMKGMDPGTPREGRGRHFGARVNLLSSAHIPEWLKATTHEEAAVPTQPAASPSSYRNPNVRRDRFDTMAKFTAQDYATDPVAILASSLFPRWNEVTKRRLYNALVDKGIATWDKSPKEGYTPLPVSIPETHHGVTRLTTRSLMVPRELVEELRGALATDLRLQPNAVGQFLTKLQVAQLADATSHLKNLHSVIANAQGTQSLMGDVARKMPGVNTVDSVVRIGKAMYEIAQDTPEIRKELAVLAKMGVLRPHYPATGLQRITKMQDLIHSVDTASRVVMNRFYDNLVQRGLAKDTFESRRQYIQQIGEYNKRLMGPLMRAANQSGLSPFIVAGRTFNRFSKRLLTGSPGFEATSRSAAVQSRMVNFTTLGAMFALPAIYNMLSTGSPGGRPGTPIGAIDLAMPEDKRGNHKVLDVLQLYGLRRGMRATGLEALTAGIKNGDSPAEIGGNAIGEAFGTAAHPWMGPALAFTTQALTGNRLDLRGGPMPQQAARMETSGAQLAENVRVALKNQNTLLYSPLRSLFGDVDTTAGWDFATDFLKAPASAVGISDRTTPAIQAARESATKVQTTPEQKERGQARRRLLAAHDEGDQKEVERLRTTHKFSPTELKDIDRERKMTPIERATWRLPLLNIVDSVWPKVQGDEVKIIREVLQRKVANANAQTPGLDKALKILRAPAPR